MTPTALPSTAVLTTWRCSYGWTFPAVLTNGNWAAMPATLQNVANIQCENCHGPGSQHLFSQGVVGNTNAISVNYAAGDCAQCHDSMNNHFKSANGTIRSMRPPPGRLPASAVRNASAAIRRPALWVGPRPAAWRC
jgi:formate-dependent nitrite reductase cytochrome c552 subunit